MVGKTFFAAALGIAAVNAQTCTIAQGTQLTGNSIFTPDQGANVPTIGQPFQVIYDGTGLGTNLRFVLYKGPGANLQEVGPIAEVTNCGTSRCAFTWTPSTSLTPATAGNGYGLRLVNLANCAYQYSVNFSLLAGTVSVASSASAAPSSRPSGSVAPSVLPSGSVLPPGPSGSAPPRPSGSGMAPPPPQPSDDCDDQPGQGGAGTGPAGGAPGGYNPPSGGYTYPNNGSYSNGTGGASPTYRPLQSNDGARMAISAFGAIVAFSAAVMAL